MESIEKIASQMVPESKKEYFKELLEKAKKKQESMTDEERREENKRRCFEQVEEHNLEAGELNYYDGYNCPICKNKGVIFKAKLYDGLWREYCVECKCKNIRHTIRLMKSSGLENLIKKHKLEDYEADEEWQKTILTSAKAFSANPCGWFYIGGQSGSGKTHICTGIAREILLKNIPTFYMVWRDGISKIKSSWKVSEQESADYMKKLKTVKCLYIDDFLKVPRGGSTSVWELEAAFEIINARYNFDSITIISSEKTINELNSLDEALASRIIEKAANPSNIISIKNSKEKNYRFKKLMEV